MLVDTRDKMVRKEKESLPYNGPPITTMCDESNGEIHPEYRA